MSDSPETVPESDPNEPARPEKRVRVTFQPSGTFVDVIPGTSLLEVAARAGYIIETPCGGSGPCGKCMVRVHEGPSEATELERECFSLEELDQGSRLGCQLSVDHEMEVELFAESLLSDSHKFLMEGVQTTGKLDPVVSKVYFDLPKPDRELPESDLERLMRVIGDVKVDLIRMRRIPSFMRKNKWRGTAVIAGDFLLRLEQGDTAKDLYGIAFDIGTTSIVGTLMDLARNKELLAISEINPQITYGDDVLSRIMHVCEDLEALVELQETIIGTINGMIRRMAERMGISQNHIYEISVAGNTTMQQLLCGLDCSALARVPFAPVFSNGQRFRAEKLGLRANPDAFVYVFPQIGGFVGGDTVSALLATRLLHRRDTCLLIDIGTNAEIAVCRGQELYATSTAAGPAFEGARIANGMRARIGAIEKVVIDEDVHLNVIGNTRPNGLCGTALIDTAAELLRHGYLDPVGRLVADQDLPSDTPPRIRRRFLGEKSGRRFVLAFENETSFEGEIALWQPDVQELQLAAGAIRAGINIVLRKIGISADELDEVLLAGAFGNFIRRMNARRIGLLPQLPCDRIKFIGNVTLLGSKLALLSEDKQQEADLIQRKTRRIDLSMDAEFQREFADAMVFPDGDFDQCNEISPFAGTREKTFLMPIRDKSPSETQLDPKP
ncbi:MAG: ASKHA domain-containing protein [Opitutales bacterium]